MGNDGFVVSHRRVVGTLSALFSLSAAFWVGRYSNDSAREPDPVIELQTSQFSLGESKLRVGDLASALQHLRAYQQQAQQLSAREPANRSYRVAESYGHSNVAAIYQRQGNLQAANDSFRQSIVLQDMLLAGTPNDIDLRHRRATCLIHRGLILRALGQTDLARRVLDTALAETQAMTRLEPSNAARLRDFASAGLATARLDLDRGRTADAIVRLREAGASLSRLLEPQPQAAMLRDLASVHINLA
ncbi:MAG: hypothetical protein ACKOEC_07640 [Acidimicrobiia bacterium]